MAHGARLRVIDRNWRSPTGDRPRGDATPRSCSARSRPVPDRYGTPETAVGRTKQRRLRVLAVEYWRLTIVTGDPIRRATITGVRIEVFEPRSNCAGPSRFVPVASQIGHRRAPSRSGRPLAGSGDGTLGRRRSSWPRTAAHGASTTPKPPSHNPIVTPGWPASRPTTANGGYDEEIIGRLGDEFAVGG